MTTQFPFSIISSVIVLLDLPPLLGAQQFCRQNKSLLYIAARIPGQYHRHESIQLKVKGLVVTLLGCDFGLKCLDHLQGGPLHNPCNMSILHDTLIQCSQFVHVPNFSRMPVRWGTDLYNSLPCGQSHVNNSPVVRDNAIISMYTIFLKFIHILMTTTLSETTQTGLVTGEESIE